MFLVDFFVLFKIYLIIFVYLTVYKNVKTRKLKKKRIKYNQ